MRSRSALPTGTKPGHDGFIGKLGAATLWEEMSAFGMELQCLAATTYDPEAGVAASAWKAGYPFSPVARIAGGTDEIQRDIIAERVLGLPGDPRVDKELPFRNLLVGK